MEVAVRQSYESPPWPRSDLAVLVDVFRASTTLAALLSKAPKEIVATNDKAQVDLLMAHGYHLVSEVFGGGLDNSPTQVLAADFVGRRIVHKTTNLTTALFAIAPHTERVLIGGFVNLARVVAAVRESGARRVELVAAAHFEGRREAVEDTACVTMMAAGLRGGEMEEIPEIARIMASLARSRGDMPHSAHYLRDVDTALNIDLLPYLPEARLASDGTFRIVGLP